MTPIAVKNRTELEPKPQRSHKKHDNGGMIMSTRNLTITIMALLALTATIATAATVRTQTGEILFQSVNADTYTTNFTYNPNYRDLAVDSAGNAHIVNANQAGHTGNLEYRRWDAATENWAPGGIIKLGGGSGEWDVKQTYLSVDDNDRVHVVYQHRDTNLTTDYSWYHAWSNDATGSTPLNAGNWNIQQLSIPTGGPGSMINIGSDTLLLAQFEDPDVRIDKAEWNAGTSSWDWTSVGTVITAENTDFSQGYFYGGPNAPALTYEDGKLHMTLYSNEVNGERGIHYTQSSNVTDPTAATWAARDHLINPDYPDYRETHGGVGVLEDGTAVALLWAANNRDNVSTEGNFTRYRDPNTGTWGDWEQIFVGDTRRMPSNGSTSTVNSAFAHDGAGGLFAAYGNQYISHWDPETETWADVFTNLAGGTGDTVNLATDINGILQTSRVYYYSFGSPVCR